MIGQRSDAFFIQRGRFVVSALFDRGVVLDRISDIQRRAVCTEIHVQKQTVSRICRTADDCYRDRCQNKTNCKNQG